MPNAMTGADEHTLLQRLAYQSWIDRGQPHGSPEVDWNCAVALVRSGLLNDIQTAAESATIAVSSSKPEPPVLTDSPHDAAEGNKGSKPRTRAKARTRTAGSETPPLEVPPSSPSPPPPTPTRMQPSRPA